MLYEKINFKIPATRKHTENARCTLISKLPLDETSIYFS